ncbi:hypothetical protein [Paenibacillus illinoisensis]|uniref:hypothetical protein n=1 Tax=Paenibacillus illinoisensis TaxID=59845 RepID=UPI003D2E87A2
MNHKKVLRLMKNLGLQASIRGKRQFNATYQAAERVVVLVLHKHKFSIENQSRMGDGCDQIPGRGAHGQRLGQKHMSRRGNCLDNAFMESFFLHLKMRVLLITKSNRGTKANVGINPFL